MWISAVRSPPFSIRSVMFFGISCICWWFAMFHGIPCIGWWSAYRMKSPWTSWEIRKNFRTKDLGIQGWTRFARSQLCIEDYRGGSSVIAISEPEGGFGSDLWEEVGEGARREMEPAGGRRGLWGDGWERRKGGGRSDGKAYLLHDSCGLRELASEDGKKKENFPPLQ